MFAHCRYAEYSEYNTPTPTGIYPKITTRITVVGNKLIPTDTIRARIPYRVGDRFHRYKSRQLIKILYGMETISSMLHSAAQEEGADGIALTITVTEKQPVVGFTFEGNYVSKKMILKKRYKLADIKAVDPQELESFAQQIKKLYAEKRLP